MQTRGFFVAITPDRMPDLARFIISLKNHNREPVQVMVVNTPMEVWKAKISAALLSRFDLTVALDTDIYVNGPLDYLFSVAERGKMGIYHERTAPVYNAGVIAYPQGIGSKLCPEWMFLHENATIGADPFSKDHYHTDQPYLNEIIRKHPIEEIPQEYNYILKEHTMEQEKADFQKVRIFHFLHGNLDLREYLSYRTWLNL